MSYFHASLLRLDVNSTINAGAWGARMIASGVRHPHYFRELELERARERVDATFPSRFKSAYAFLDQQYASGFAQMQVGQQGIPTLLYEVEPVTGSQECRLPMGYIDSWSQLCTREEIEQWAEGYWRSAPYSEQDSEVLVSDGLVVKGMLDRFTPNGW